MDGRAKSDGASLPPASRSAQPVLVHATALVIGEKGLLIRGQSGSGKTTLARHLIAEARRQGLFARLIGDDRIAIAMAGRHPVLRAHPAIAGRIEKRWEGISSTAHEPAAILACVVDLVDKAKDIPRLPELQDRSVLWGSANIPRLSLPAGLSPATQTLRILDFVRPEKGAAD